MKREEDLLEMFSCNIRGLRQEKGWSQAELARQADISAAAINQLEKGSRNPTIAVSGKLALALDANVSDLFSDASEAAKGDIEKFYRKYSFLRELSEEDEKMIVGLAKKLVRK